MQNLNSRYADGNLIQLPDREAAMQNLINMQADEIRWLKLKILDMEEMIENLTGGGND